MRALLKMLRIRALVVHDIPSKLSKKVLREDPKHLSPNPLFSKVPSPMNKAIEDYITLKINSSLGSPNAMDIRFQDSSISPTPDLVKKYFISNDENKVRITQTIAQYLYEIQNATNSSGLILFVECDLGQKSALVIMKVEREEGLEITEKNERENFLTFTVEHIDNLLLTKKTKLFKIAMFYYVDKEIHGSICDNQTSYYEQKDTADFFINRFLGCEFFQSSKESTRDFYETTIKYVNEKIESPEEKGHVVTQLIAELTNRRLVFNVREFSRTIFPPKKRDDFLEYLNESGSKSQAFQKDTELIQGKLSRIQYGFASGISVIGKKEALEAKTKIRNNEDGSATFEIIDTLDKVQTK